MKTEYSEDELPLDPAFASILLVWKAEVRESRIGKSGRQKGRLGISQPGNSALQLFPVLQHIISLCPSHCVSERVTAGLARVKREGKTLGRTKAVASVTQMRKLAEQGLSAVKIGERIGVPRMTVARRLARF